jgi:multicomponent Na+:H+ antiporter subunit G
VSVADLAPDLLRNIFLGLGAFFVLVGALGLLRMPDVFTRAHAGSVLETLGVGFLIVGMMIEAGFGLVSAKLFFILALIFLTGPVVVHALTQAALHSGTEPLLTEDRRKDDASASTGGSSSRS